MEILLPINVGRNNTLKHHHTIWRFMQPKLWQSTGSGTLQYSFRVVSH
ncbi:MAG: hypothetical protein ACMXYF_04855 [Candidatus Woesearchaeota archaeon]